MISEIRLGVLGGTFDPIHYGHLRLADEALETFGLERVIFVPAGVPPHKQSDHVTSARDRLAMSLLATASHPRFEVSTIELDRGGPSYTVDTLAELQHALGSRAALFFILGADAVLEMSTWREPERVLSLCHLAISSRPGIDLNRLREVPVRGLMDRVKVFEGPTVQLSSTEIRTRVSAGKSIRYLVPEAVESYIEKRGMYQNRIRGEREETFGNPGT